MIIGAIFKNALVGVLALSALTACSGGPQPLASADQSTQQAVQPAEASTYAEDRAAILSMVGNYRVTFDFTETVSFAADYTLKDKKISKAREIVRVIEDTGDFISLQHILVVGDGPYFPVKHWRQDWRYEPSFVMDYLGGNAWQKKILSKAESEGKWSQTVYQVDDGLRYGGVAAWSYDNGFPVWEAAPSMRPLPRRDATTRDDYHAILATNRHAITPIGWVHEQDNAKLILTGDTPQVLVHEIGINTYVKASDYEDTVALTYWEQTSDFWAGVRAIWTTLETDHGAYGLTVQGEPEAIYMPLLGIAEGFADGNLTLDQALEDAEDIIETHTVTDLQPLLQRLESAAFETSIGR